VSVNNERGMKMGDQWFLKEFECTCKKKYWFDVGEMDVVTKAAPDFPETRDYVYFCTGCNTNKIAFYTKDDIELVKGSVPAQPAGVGKQ
jgi:hypothetical protein